METGNPNTKAKQFGDGVMYRAKCVSELKAESDSVVRDRKRVWMRLIQIALPLLAFMYYAVPVWRYYAWGIIIPTSLVLFMFLDYMNHLRHVWDIRVRQDKLIIKEDRVEINYAITRPDRWDIVSPYILYLCCCALVIAFFHIAENYEAKHGDSVLAERLRKQSGGPLVVESVVAKSASSFIAKDKSSRTK